MDIDKKTILAFLLIGFVLILVNTPFYQKTFNPKGYEARQRLLEQKRQQQMEGISEQAEQQLKSPEVEGKTPVVEEEPVVVKKNKVSSNIQQNPNLPEKLITIETDLYKAQLSTKGAVLKKWELKKFKDQEKKNVQMLADDPNGDLGVEFVTVEGDTLNTSLCFFTVTADTFIQLKNDEKTTLTFITDLGEGKQIIKEMEFLNHVYHINLKVTLLNMENYILGKAFSLNTPSGLNSTEKILKDDMYYSKAGLAAGGQVNKKFKPNGEIYNIPGVIDWVGVRTKYFALAMIPENKKGDAAVIKGEEIALEPNARIKWKKYSIQLVMPYLSGRREQNQFKIYIGPLDNDIVKSYGVNLEKFMDFGAKVIQPFSHAILWSFKKLHTVIPNYGVVLILFSIIIKIIVYPLTHKSYESMKKMQALQPKLNELKEKYKNDPQKLNQETMKMYKQEKVNPLGGCLPMLLQMPLLWGLFIVFRSTIELRGEGFVWWIKDLANPDTVATLPFSIPMYGNSVNILPLFMGPTMLIQQKLTVTDPKQKAMVYFMPIFLTLLFNSFPSGLNLYYALFNLLSIIQQKYLVPSPVAANQESVVKRKKR